MMRYALTGLITIVTLGSTSPAYAYCCWNPAICQAVCGSACCGANLSVGTPQDPAGLRNFSVQDLQRAQTEARREARSSDFLKVLDAEIERRSSSGPAQRTR